MMSIEIEKALKIVSQKMIGINYALIGSVNLLVQGMDMNPGDLDLLIGQEDMEEVAGRLEEYKTKDFYFDESEGRNSYRSFFDIGGVEVEVLVNINNLCRSKHTLDDKIEMEYKGIKLTGISLEKELEAYKNMGRQKKVDLIEKYIKSRK